TFADELAVEPLALVDVRTDQLASAQRLLRDPRSRHRREAAHERAEHCAEQRRVEAHGCGSRSSLVTCRSLAMESSNSVLEPNSRCRPVTRFSRRPARAPGLASLRSF